MKHPCVYFYMLMATCHSSLTLFADSGQTVLTNSIINTTDFPGLVFQNQNASSWNYDIDANNMPLRVASVTQNAQFINIELSLEYAEFNSTNAAKNAVLFNLNNAATRSKTGIWKEATQPKIGDFSWYSTSSNSVDLFVVSKTTCFSIFGFNGTDAERKTLIEQLALKIVKKIEGGGKVLMPDGTPPPEPPSTEREEDDEEDE